MIGAVLRAASSLDPAYSEGSCEGRGKLVAMFEDSRWPCIAAPLQKLAILFHRPRDFAPIMRQSRFSNKKVPFGDGQGHYSDRLLGSGAAESFSTSGSGSPAFQSGKRSLFCSNQSR